ncbi:hypothetical protein [Streptosporangium carneum]|uniref:Uncharacterized protein n=1 Tax=Streptosporangium carneum TaxID=47481 RepID=A0A9W6MHC5_9ACTN|nr:hypothetical protein [Streptosporangium carneum]GLK14035.1 hypothetical protein GCM10017600_74470 [Streptosporangium carneum]
MPEFRRFSPAALAMSVEGVVAEKPRCSRTGPTGGGEVSGILANIGPTLFAKYSWHDRTIRCHRVQTRQRFGMQPTGEAGGEQGAE